MKKKLFCIHNNCLLFVEIRIKPPRRRIPNKINEDEIFNLEELYDRPLDGQPLDDDALNIKIVTLVVLLLI